MLYICYINVGNLPKKKSDEYMKDMMKKTKDDGWLKEDERMWWIAVRGDEPTRIEVLRYDEPPVTIPAGSVYTSPTNAASPTAV